MKKLIQVIPAVLALLVIGFSYFSQWCIHDGGICFRTWLDRTYLYTISPLHFFSLYFLPIAIIVIFVRREVFISWFNFAICAVVLAIIFMSTQQVYPPMFSTGRDDSAILSGQVFAVISLIVIIWRAIRYHKKLGHPMS